MCARRVYTYKWLFRVSIECTLCTDARSVLLVLVINKKIYSPVRDGFVVIRHDSKQYINGLRS